MTVNKMKNFGRSAIVRKPNETMRAIVTTVVGVVFGFLIGVSFPILSLTKFNLAYSLLPSINISHTADNNTSLSTQSVARNVNTTSKLNLAYSLLPSINISHTADNNTSLSTQSDARNVNTTSKLNLAYSLLPSINISHTADNNTSLSTQSDARNVNTTSKLNLAYSLLPSINISHTTDNNTSLSTQSDARNVNTTSKIWVPSNPRGAERLPPGIVTSKSDYYLHRLYGKPSEDRTIKQKYLVSFTVGYDQRATIDAAIKKFSENFTILLFHYDGRTSKWDEFEWSKRAIHVSVAKQTKWWYAKRFLHPDIIAQYDYIFIWDEDLGVEHFNAEEYVKLVRKHGLEISQPGLDPNSRGLTWQMTKRRGDREVHKETEEKPGWCSDPHLPPCAEFIEIMAPVFSRDAWRCVWHMIQNDLIHGWGIDFALRKCVEPAHEKIGVVDAQWIVHQSVPSLGKQGQAENGKTPSQGVKERCRREWKMFTDRMTMAERAYTESMRIDPSNPTSHRQPKRS